MRSRLRIILYALALGLMAWWFDALIDYTVFYADRSFLDMLVLDPPPHEFYMRSVVLALFLGFGLLSAHALERHARANAVARRLNGTLRAVHAVQQVAAREREPRRLLREACRALAESAGYARAFAVTFDGGSVRDVAQAGFGAGEALVRALRSRGVPEALRRVLATPGFVAVSPKDIMPDTMPEADTAGRAFATRMMSHHHPMGVLVVCIEFDAEPRAEERLLLEEAAEAVALGLSGLAQAERRRRSEEQNRRQLKDVSDVVDILTQLSAETDTDALCRRAIELGRERLSIDRMSIWLVDVDGGGPQAVRGTFGTDEAGHTRDERQARLRVGVATSMGRVLAGESRIEIRSEPLRDEKAGPRGEGWHAVAAIERRDGSTAGALCVDRLSSGGEPDDHTVELLRLYAAAVGALLEGVWSEETLREGERKYRSLFRNALVGLARIDIGTNAVLACNERMLEMFGLDDGAALRRALAEGALFAHPGVWDDILVLLKREGELRAREFRVMRADGAQIWARLTARLYPDEGYVELVAVDVTEEKLARNAVRSRQRVLESLARLHSHIGRLTSEGVTRAALDSLFDSTGMAHVAVVLAVEGDAAICRVAAVRGREGQLLVEGRDIPVEGSALVTAFESSDPQYRAAIQPEGSPLEGTLHAAGVRSYVVAPLWSEGRCLGALMGFSMAEDGIVDEDRHLFSLTAPSLAQALANSRLYESLRDSEKRYHALFESMLDGSALHRVVYDDAGRAVDYVLLDVNPAFERITGLKRADVTGRRASEVYGVETAPYLDRYVPVAEGGPAIVFDTYYPPMNQHFRISVFSPGHGQFATVFMDITQQRRAEQRNAALSALAELFLANESLDSTCRRIPGELAARLDFPMARLELYDEVRRHLVLAGCEGDVPDPVGTKCALDVTIGGCVAASGEAIHVGDMGDRDDLAGLVPEGVRSVVAVPVRTEDVTIGGFVLMDSRPREDVVGIADVVEHVMFHAAQEIRRKQAVEALRMSREQLRNIVENAGMGIALLNSRREVIEANRTLREWFPDIEPGTSTECICRTAHPADERLFECPTAQTLADGQVHETLAQYHVAGGVVWHRIVSSPLHDADGHVSGAIEIVEDITERVMAERELESVLRLHANTVAGIPSALLVLDGAQRVIMANLRYVEAYVTEGSPVTGQPLKEVLPEGLDDHAGLAEGIRRVLAKGGDLDLPDVCLMEDSEHARYLNIRIRAVGKHGAVQSESDAHLLLVIDDVTDRRRLEEQLRHSAKMESLGKLAGGVAHDFNNILTGVIGYAQLIARKVTDDPETERDLSEILKLAERAATLTQQLLAFGRRQSLQQRPLDLNRLVADMLNMLRRFTGEPIELIFAPDEDLGVVLADPSQIEQVVLNLVINARDAMPDGGTLTLRTHNRRVDAGEIEGVEKPGDYAALEVIDTGHGIDESTLGRIFEPFYSTKPSRGGSGLGLAMVYGIVRQHQGAIQVESELGAGSTFRVLLPWTEGKPELDLVAGEQAVVYGEETILVAEDEEDVRTVTKRILEGFGYRVLTAANADEAEEIFEAHAGEIDLLLTDVVMPGRNGVELARALRDRDPSLAVVTMSGYTDTVTFRRAEVDPERFLQKPFKPEALGRKLREALDGSGKAKG